MNINIFPLLVNLKNNKNIAWNPTHNVWIHFLLTVKLYIPNNIEPITLPVPFKVPNIPNLASFMFKDILISFVADDIKPADIFMAPSTLITIKNKKRR